MRQEAEGRGREGGHTFGVWAPGAHTLEVFVAGTRHPMPRGEGGWWTVEVSGAGPGTDYGFCVDGKDPLPDPRSGWQPHGVHGLSRVVDHAAFAWHDDGWQPPPLAAGLFYEIHVGTFTPEGTFDAAIGRLDYLRELGVTHLEVMPVAQFPGARNWGYDGVQLFAPHHAFGGPDGFKRLVDACHARGMAVVLDVVYNHLGPEGNYLAQYGPYFTTRYQTPWSQAVNFDGGDSDEVRRFFIDNARLWFADYHVDGLRLDAVHAIFDESAVHILEELARDKEVLEAHLGRPLALIAESDLNDPRLVQSREAGGYGLDAQWSDDFHHALHTVLTGEQSGYYADFTGLKDLATALCRVFVNDGRYSRFRQRRHGRPVAGLPASRFLGYLQNHDQVGNRARGDRMSHLVDPERLKVGAALVLLSPFVPMLFQGEEWGATSPFQYFTSHGDEALGEAVSRGRREEFAAFGWDPAEIPDPQAEATFQRSRLDWDEHTRGSHADLLAWHRALIQLRRAYPAFTDPRLDRTVVSFDEAAGWLVLQRDGLAVACNLGAGMQPVPLPHEGRLLLASREETELAGRLVHLPPNGVAVVQRA